MLASQHCWCKELCVLFRPYLHPHHQYSRLWAQMSINNTCHSVYSGANEELIVTQTTAVIMQYVWPFTSPDVTQSQESWLCRVLALVRPSLGLEASCSACLVPSENRNSDPWSEAEALPREAPDEGKVEELLRFFFPDEAEDLGKVEDEDFKDFPGGEANSGGPSGVTGALAVFLDRWCRGCEPPWSWWTGDPLPLELVPAADLAELVWVLIVPWLAESNMGFTILAVETCIVQS